MTTATGVSGPAIQLSRNESAYRMAPAAAAAVRAAGANASRYPDRSHAGLTMAIARHQGVPAECVLIANGATQLVLMAALTLGRPGGIMVTAAASWPGYADMCAIAAVPVEPLALHGYRLPVMDLAGRLAQGASAFICNPHNPTGSTLREDEVNDLAGAAERGGAVAIFDEAYAEYAGSAFCSAVPAVRDGRPVIVLRTFSKAFGLAGLRIGYAIAPVELINTLTAASIPYAVSSVAQQAALASLADPGFVHQVTGRTTAIRDASASWLRRHGFGTAENGANFLLVQVPVASSALCHVLEQDHGIVVCDAASMGFPRHIRVTVGTRADMKAFTAALPAAVQRAAEIPAGSVPVRDPAGYLRGDGVPAGARPVVTA
jgi:histidinol-phosphate aminotransferase